MQQHSVQYYPQLESTSNEHIFDYISLYGVQKTAQLGSAIKSTEPGCSSPSHGFESCLFNPQIFLGVLMHMLNITKESQDTKKISYELSSYHLPLKIRNIITQADWSTLWLLNSKVSLHWSAVQVQYLIKHYVSLEGLPDGVQWGQKIGSIAN